MAVESAGDPRGALDMRAIILLLALVGIWLLWSGIFLPLILAFGALSCLLVAWLCHRFSIIDAEGAPFHVVLRVLVYIPWLLLEIVKSSIDVTRRVLSPRLPVSPCLVEVPITQRTELGRTIFANSITLTPGTVSYASDERVILVHAIARDVRDGLLDGAMDRKCTWVEGAR